MKKMELQSLKQTVCTWKWMLGRRWFPFRAQLRCNFYKVGPYDLYFIPTVDANSLHPSAKRRSQVVRYTAPPPWKRPGWHPETRNLVPTGWGRMDVVRPPVILLMAEIRQTHQLRLVLYPHYFTRVSWPSKRWLFLGFQPSTVVTGFCPMVLEQKRRQAKEITLRHHVWL